LGTGADGVPEEAPRQEKAREKEEAPALETPQGNVVRPATRRKLPQEIRKRIGRKIDELAYEPRPPDGILATHAGKTQIGRAANRSSRDSCSTQTPRSRRAFRVSGD
jgi:hypothetical protein